MKRNARSTKGGFAAFFHKNNVIFFMAPLIFLCHCVQGSYRSNPGNFEQD
jgi:hypothetical protein